jgi:hypothetical protein
MRTKKMGGSFVQRLDTRRPLNQRRNNIGIVIRLPKSRRSARRRIREIVPTTFVAQLSVQGFPPLTFFLGVDQRKFSPFRDRNVSAAGNFQQPQRTLRLFLHPLISADRGNAQHVKLVSLQKNQDRLHVGRSRPSRILVDDNFDFLRLQVAGGHQHRENHEVNDDGAPSCGPLLLCNLAWA